MQCPSQSNMLMGLVALMKKLCIVVQKQKCSWRRGMGSPTPQPILQSFEEEKKGSKQPKVLFFLKAIFGDQFNNNNKIYLLISAITVLWDVVRISRDSLGTEKISVFKEFQSVQITSVGCKMFSPKKKVKLSADFAKWEIASSNGFEILFLKWKCFRLFRENKWTKFFESRRNSNRNMPNIRQPQDNVRLVPLPPLFRPPFQLSNSSFVGKKNWKKSVENQTVQGAGTSNCCVGEVYEMQFSSQNQVRLTWVLRTKIPGQKRKSVCPELRSLSQRHPLPHGLSPWLHPQRECTHPGAQKTFTSVYLFRH